MQHKISIEHQSLDAKIEMALESQFAAGRLYASISSRPGQSGRADGYILEGKELEVSVLYVYLHPSLISAISSISERSGLASRSTHSRLDAALFLTFLLHYHHHNEAEGVLACTAVDCEKNSMTMYSSITPTSMQYMLSIAMQLTRT